MGAAVVVIRCKGERRERRERRGDLRPSCPRPSPRRPTSRPPPSPPLLPLIPGRTCPQQGWLSWRQSRPRPSSWPLPGMDSSTRRRSTRPHHRHPRHPRNHRCRRRLRRPRHRHRARLQRVDEIHPCRLHPRQQRHPRCNPPTATTKERRTEVGDGGGSVSAPHATGHTSWQHTKRCSIEQSRDGARSKSRLAERTSKRERGGGGGVDAQAEAERW